MQIILNKYFPVFHYCNKNGILVMFDTGTLKVLRQLRLSISLQWYIAVPV